MRNLRNVRFGRWALDHSSDITATCWDSDKDEVLCTKGPTVDDPSIELIRLSQTEPFSHQTIARWDALSPNPDLPADRVVSIQCLGGLGTTCIVLEGGDVITIQEDHSGHDAARIEVVGSIDAGIAAAAWSPDEELLVVVTKADNVVFMTSSLDPLAEVNMSPDDLKASKHVSVGWGKKETQFQGRGAKALRDPTIPEKVDQGLPSPHEDGATTISWRGDGAYVAINSARQADRRVIRVYSREGELDGASEPVDGLESALSWRPSGNLIAAVQRLGDNVDIIFFERNGLRHGQFTLRTLDDKPAPESIRLQWNSDSTVLAVLLPGRIQLWTMGNYHWYLKQDIPHDSSLPRLSWHPEKALRFAAATPESIIVTEQIFHVSRGTCRPPHDNGVVAVIDGRTIKLTAFRTANVPPPMSLFEVEADAVVADVAFGHSNASFAVLHGKGVDVYDMPMKNGRSTKPQLREKIPFPTQEATGSWLPLRVCYAANGTYRCTVHQGDRGDSHFGVEIGTGSMIILDDKRHLASTSTFEDDVSLEGYAQDLSGNLYRLTESDSELLPIRFPSHLPWFEMCKQETATLAFGLSRNGHIYANSRLLAKNCTSFAVTPSHLIFTTSNHLVKYVHLTPDVQELEVPADDPEKDERCRSVERGSRLVTAIPTNMSIVLQMPRGNLETIYPRAMVVAGIRSLIEEKDYARAFSYCRTQRVDMNIIHDHQPAQFLANVGLFLDQLKEVTHIDLFLSSLREEDVTQTMYQDTKRRRHQADTDSAGQDGSRLQPLCSKVNTVCDALLKRLQPRKSTNLQNIITAHVCKIPPALDDGLTLVAELMQEDEKLAEKAIEHICFLVDVNRVYENALGLYDLALALLVAQQSQRDPREYLPFIQNLHALSEVRRKFEIDDHLARRPKALVHLQELDAFDELCDYTAKHALFQDALKLYRYDQPRLRTLTDLYAAHLESKSAFREAGLAYESLQNYARATSCYRAAGATCWQECLYAAQQQVPSLSADAMNELATTLADALWEAKDYSAAATIHLDHLDSLETAVRSLCKGYHFAEAMRIVVQRGRPDLLESAVDAGLSEALGSTTEFLADCKSQLLAQVPRIAELPEAERLVFALVRRGMAERARAAEGLMADVLDACERAVAQVFAAPDAAQDAAGDNAGGDGAGVDNQGAEGAWRATGGDAVLQDWMLGRSKRLEPPVVKGMKKLALLG
ncbi:hypothetical protein HIM_01580 [Hirsutella minnesotensis 3608]|nr:hypothetical protein HIM_01580 [Hirsutella minnesotensis 3608]